MATYETAKRMEHKCRVRRSMGANFIHRICWDSSILVYDIPTKTARDHIVRVLNQDYGRWYAPEQYCALEIPDEYIGYRICISFEDDACNWTIHGTENEMLTEWMDTIRKLFRN